MQGICQIRKLLLRISRSAVGQLWRIIKTPGISPVIFLPVSSPRFHDLYRIIQHIKRFCLRRLFGKFIQGHQNQGIDSQVFQIGNKFLQPQEGAGMSDSRRFFHGQASYICLIENTVLIWDHRHGCFLPVIFLPDAPDFLPVLPLLCPLSLPGRRPGMAEISFSDPGRTGITDYMAVYPVIVLQPLFRGDFHTDRCRQPDSFFLRQRDFLAGEFLSFTIKQKLCLRSLRKHHGKADPISLRPCSGMLRPSHGHCVICPVLHTPVSFSAVCTLAFLLQKNICLFIRIY